MAIKLVVSRDFAYDVIYNISIYVKGQYEENYYTKKRETAYDLSYKFQREPANLDRGNKCSLLNYLFIDTHIAKKFKTRTRELKNPRKLY